MILLETYNRAQLKEWVLSGKHAQHSFLPITLHRALSQCENPTITEEDPLLIVAYINNELAGYLGLLPGEIYINPSIKTKITWLSTIYISPKFRGKKLVEQLLNKAFDLYDGKIALTEFTAQAESVFRRMPTLHSLPAKQGKRYYLQSNWEELLPSKIKGASSFVSVLKLIDTFSNSIFNFLTKKKKLLPFHYEICNTLDQESRKMMADFRCNRSAEELEWIMTHPWILEGNNTEDKYHFSSYALSMKYFWVKIYSPNNELKTCALLSVRNGHLKVQYLFDNKNIDAFMAFLEQFCIEKKIKMFTCFQHKINEWMEQHPFRKWLTRNFERRYFIHQNTYQLLDSVNHLDFQDGDGDCVFT